MSEIERSRLLLWQGNWQRAAWVDTYLFNEHPESVRRYEVKYRNGELRFAGSLAKHSTSKSMDATGYAHLAKDISLSRASCQEKGKALFQASAVIWTV